jgi:hypothetical protein
VSVFIVCCPQGTFGTSCAECPGGKDRPCSGNGNCDVCVFYRLILIYILVFRLNEVNCLICFHRP